MSDLATTDDLEARLGRDLTTAEAARAAGVLADVSASIRSYCGQLFDEAESTQRLRVRRGRVRLPQRPVTEVESVVDKAAVAVPFTWDGLDVVLIGAMVADTWAVEPWRTGLSVVDVTYTHGYATIPADLVGVACSVALRALGQSPTMGGITTESIEGYSYSLGPAGAAGSFGLLNDERAALDRYKRSATFIEGVALW